MENISIWFVAPFAVLLFMIAFPPLFSHHWKEWWERAEVKKTFVLSSILAVATAVAMGYNFGSEGLGELWHSLLMDYGPFMVMVGVPYVISGGVGIRVIARPTPTVNLALLTVGCLLGAIFGTTGASVLMIRPLLEVNRQRKSKVHLVIAAIWMISNMGGLLTPIGPPLVMGFISSENPVPFFWPAENLWQFWALSSAALLMVIFVVDTFLFKREGGHNIRLSEPASVTISGWRNIGLLGGVIVAMVTLTSPIREGALIGLGALAFFTTKTEVRQANGFKWKPVLVVAALFFGIFVTMKPALLVMARLAPELGLDTPMEFYVAAGALSTWLDNAPTYLVLLQVAIALGLGNQIAGTTIQVLAGISAGAASWGLGTYISNAPNPLIKEIAEADGISMPSFMVYFCISCAVPLPILYGVGWYFFG